MKTKQSPEGATQRVRFVYDEDYEYSSDELPQTPEAYEGYEFHKDGQPIPFDEYMRTYGNIDNHIAVGIVHEVKCECCGHWSVKDSLWGVDCMVWDHVPVDETFYPEQLDDIKEDYLNELARDYFGIPLPRPHIRPQS